MPATVRLQRYLAAAGVAARRKAEELITAGRVRVNGAVVKVLGTKVDPDVDQVEVDGEAVVPHDKFYIVFNKPKGCITAVTDDRGRATVMDYLPNLPVPVKPVGRLDFYSEGVLLLTNDGELAARLLAPASHVPKTYHVKVHGQLGPDDIRDLRQGITLDDGQTTMPADVEVLPGESKHTWLGITIHEGKHRQIHRMLEALNYRVDKLQRVAFANLTFHDLRIGDARELTQTELNELRDLVKLDRSAVARGAWRANREDTDIPRRARAKARAEADDNPDDTDLDMIEDADAQQEDPTASLPSAASAASRFASTARRGDDASTNASRGAGARGESASRGDSRGPRQSHGSRDSRGAGQSYGSRGDSRGPGGGGARGAGGSRGDSRSAGQSSGSRDSRGAGGSRGDSRSAGQSSSSRDSRGAGQSYASGGAGGSRGGGVRGARGDSRGAGGSRGDSRSSAGQSVGPRGDSRGAGQSYASGGAGGSRGAGSRGARGDSRGAGGSRGDSRSSAGKSVGPRGDSRGAGRSTRKGSTRGSPTPTSDKRRSFGSRSNTKSKPAKR